MNRRHRRIRAITMTFNAITMTATGIALAWVLIFVLSGGNQTLPPCQTEDSTHCFWDASEMGNGEGHDFVAP